MEVKKCAPLVQAVFLFGMRGQVGTGRTESWETLGRGLEPARDHLDGDRERVQQLCTRIQAKDPQERDNLN